MNPDGIDQACETPLVDLIACLVEHLKRPDARLFVEGDLWSVVFGDRAVCYEIALRLASTLPRPTSGGEA